MSKKNSKPYSNYHSDRNNNKKMTRVKKNSNIKGKIGEEREKKLESTTRIRIDKDRLNDIDSLDTSFLEGRTGRVNYNNKNTKKQKKVVNYKSKTMEYAFLKRVCYSLSIIIVLVLGGLILYNNNIFFENEDVSSNKEIKEEKEQKEETKENEEKIIDDNYLFIGDYNTDKFNFEWYDLDYHYNKSSGNDYVIQDILDNMKEKVYIYNPSKVFIELGVNDLKNGDSKDKVISNLEELIKNIKTNRPYAKIYVESIYPYNSDIEGYDEDFFDSKVSIEDITDINDEIKELCKDTKVSYLDIYKELSKDDKLDSKYTDDGIYLNDKGYDVVYKKIKKIIDED